MTAQPSLSYSLTTGDWLLVREGSNWRFEHMGDALRAANYLPVSALAGRHDRALEQIMGTATFSGGGVSGCRLLLVPFRPGAPAEEVAIECFEVAASEAEWLDGMYRDGWLACEATLTVESAEQFGLRAYLPRHAGLEEKQLRLSIDHEPAGEFVIPRGKMTEFVVEIPANGKSVRTIGLKASYAEPIAPNGDQRPLGVLVSAMKLGNAEWQKIR